MRKSYGRIRLPSEGSTSPLTGLTIAIAIAVGVVLGGLFMAVVFAL